MEYLQATRPEDCYREAATIKRKALCSFSAADFRPALSALADLVQHDVWREPIGFLSIP